MIAQHLRDSLDEQIEYGDYQIAAQIYQKKVKKQITPRYLHKFIKGQKNPAGRPGCHDPSAMFEAVAQAVRERQQREREASQKADELIRTILRDTKPQPIAL